MSLSGAETTGIFTLGGIVLTGGMALLTARMARQGEDRRARADLSAKISAEQRAERRQTFVDLLTQLDEVMKFAQLEGRSAAESGDVADYSNAAFEKIAAMRRQQLLCSLTMPLEDAPVIDAFVKTVAHMAVVPLADRDGEPLPDLPHVTAQLRALNHEASTNRTKVVELMHGLLNPATGQWRQAPETRP